VTDPEFIQCLLREAGPSRAWSFVGSIAYLRTRHGVFKLEPWSDGVHGHVAGLLGTHTTSTGAQDRVVFEFHDLLQPDRKALKNPDLADTHRIHAWHTGDGPRRQIAWYVPPLSLQPLHAAIDAWIAAWSDA
jgi:hypothetical protein